jgi:glycopeptide antibiotics resistance protein
VAPVRRGTIVIYRILWIAYIVAIGLGTTAPFLFTTDHQIVSMKIAHVSPNIFVDTWKGGPVAMTDVGLNVLLFVPFGVLGGLSEHTSHSSFARRVLLVTLLGLLVSLGVETAQVFTRNRIPSSTDVVTNTLGAFLGAWMLRGRRA